MMSSAGHSGLPGTTRPAVTTFALLKAMNTPPLTDRLAGRPELGIYLRLGDPSDPEAHQAAEHQDPAVHGRESTEDPVVQRPEHADLQPLRRRETPSHGASQHLQVAGLHVFQVTNRVMLKGKPHRTLCGCCQPPGGVWQNGEAFLLVPVIGIY